MNYQIFTHCLHEKQIRRFFVSRTERDLYKKIESELNQIVNNMRNNGSIRQLSRQNLYDYVQLRVDSLDRTKFKDFVYYYRLIWHMQDYVDILYEKRVFKLGIGIPYRMFKYSEHLLINEETT